MNTWIVFLRGVMPTGKDKVPKEIRRFHNFPKLQHHAEDDRT